MTLMVGLRRFLGMIEVHHSSASRTVREHVAQPRHRLRWDLRAWRQR